MEALLSALLLLLLQLCCAAAPLSCSDFDNHAASQLAVRHINSHHRHGYKFSLGGLSAAHLDQVHDGCQVQLQLQLKETTCHTVNPKDVQECNPRRQGERAVVANCSVLMTVRDTNATVTRYDCETRQEMTGREMALICPDCPNLISLNDPSGLMSIHAAVTEFNKNVSNQNVFVLQEVGRIKLGYVSSTGMNYYSEFLLVETPCPVQSRILHRACRPMCPHRARHAFCRSSYSKAEGLRLPLDCEFYPAKNTTVLGPGEQEPTCDPPHPIGPPDTPPHAHGPPPHAHGPPPHAHKPPPHTRGSPPHAHGPPPHAHGPPPPTRGPPPPQGKQRPGVPLLPPPPLPDHCPGVLVAADPALHPICPWPLAGPRPSGG